MDHVTGRWSQQSSLWDYLVYNYEVTFESHQAFVRDHGCRLLNSFGNVSVVFGSRKENDVYLDSRHVS